MRTPVRSLVALVVATALGMSACSSSGGGSSSNTNSKDTFCGLLLTFRATIDELTTGVGSGDAARTEEVIERMVSQADVLQDRAPDDIKPDVDTYASFITDVNTLFASKGYDIAAIEADEQAAATFSELNSDEVNASLEQLRAYAEQDCAATGTS